MKTLHRCHKCGKKLIDRNAQEVGMCLNCFAIEQSDFDEDEDEYNESEQFKEPSSPSLQSKTAERLTPMQIAVYAVNCPNTDECINEIAGLIEKDRKEIERLREEHGIMCERIGEMGALIDEVEELRLYKHSCNESIAHLHRENERLRNYNDELVEIVNRLKEENQTLKTQVDSIYKASKAMVSSLKVIKALNPSQEENKQL